MATKILIIGAVNGDLATLLPRLTTLHAKQNFTMAVIVGDLFPPEVSDGGGSGGDELLRKLWNGELEIPLPVYFSVGRSEVSETVMKRLEECLEEHAGEVCQNLVFLGRKGVLVTSDGVRIVVLGGRLAPKDEQQGTGGGEGQLEVNENTHPWYTEAEANALKVAESADILVTYDWPAGVDRNSNVPITNSGSGDDKGSLPGGGSVPVRELARHLGPRYHFVAGGERVFWEREPYRNQSVEGKKGRRFFGAMGTDLGATRFIAVADWGNQGKVKALYAFNLNVKDYAGEVVPADATESPYAGIGRPSGPSRGKRPLPADSDTPGELPAEVGADGSFFWGEQDRGHQEKRPRDSSHRGGRNPLPTQKARYLAGSCFFCLSSPDIQTHLITNIGNDSYMTTCRGPLTTQATNPPVLPFPAHVLIIPLAHAQTLAQADDPAQTYAEMLRFRSALDRMFRARGAGAVCFEVSRGTKGMHAHWQVIPVSTEKLASVVGRFQLTARQEGLGEFVERSGKELLCSEDSRGDSYFRVWVSPGDTGDRHTLTASGSSSTGTQEIKSENEGQGKGEVEVEDKWLCLPLMMDQYFDLQFGRRVLAGVIGGESAERVNWKHCKQSVDEEKQDAEAFKSAFQPWDFTL